MPPTARLAGMVTAATVVLAGLFPVAAAAAGSTYTITQLTQEEQVSGGYGTPWPELSASGTAVVFPATTYLMPDGSDCVLPDDPSAPLPDGCAETTQVYLRTTDGAATTLLTRTPAGPDQPSLGHATSPSPSADASVVAFASDAADLVAGVGGTGFPLPYVWRATSGVSAAPIPDLSSGPADVDLLSLSADGTRLAYAVRSDPDSSNGSAPSSRVVVVDLTTERVLHDQPVLFDVSTVRLSGDGSTLAYAAYEDPASQLETLHVVDVDPWKELKSFFAGSQYWSEDTANSAASLSDDGRYVAFLYQPYNDEASSNRPGQLAVWDRENPDTAPAAVLVQPGESGIPEARHPALSGDGSTITYTADAYVEGQVYANALPDGTPVLVSADVDGQPAGGTSGNEQPTISRDGKTIAFVSDSKALGDGYPYDRIFVATRGDSEDTTAPTWPAQAALTATVQGTNGVDLSWPQAADDVGVGGYRITRNGTTLAAVGSGTTSYQITSGLSSGTTYTFTVVAVDAAANSSDPLSATVTTVAHLLASTRGTDTVDLSWDAAAGDDVTGYRVQRVDHGSDGSTSVTAVTDVGAGTTSYEMSDLDSRTTYTFRVDVLRSGAAEPWTDEAQVSTPALAISSLDYDVTRGMGERYAAVGSDLTVTLVGSPRQTAVAELAGLGPDAQPIELALTEGQPGVYTGALEVQPGLKVGGVHGVLSDRVHQAARDMDASYFPLYGGSRLDVTVQEGADPLQDAQLKVANSDGIYYRPATAPGEYHLSVDQGTWSVSLVNGDGEVVAAQRGIVVGDDPVAVDLLPVRTATLTVDVTPPEGEPGGGVTVAVTGADGKQLASADLPAGQTSVALPALPSHETVTVTATLDDPHRLLRLHESTTTTLAAGANTVTLAQHALARGRVEASVVHGSTAAAGASVTVTQTVDGRSWPWTGTTDADGHASLEVLAGEAHVAAVMPDYLTDATTVDVPADGSAAAALSLQRIPGYRVSVHLFTQNAGGAEVEQVLDWTTAIHFRARLTAPGWSRSGNGVLPLNQVDATQGGEISFCADGQEGGLSAACDTQQLGTDPQIDLSVHLVQGGRYVGHLVQADGSDSTGSWSAHVVQVDGDGRWSARQSGVGSDLSVRVPAAGTYEVSVDAAGASGSLHSAPYSATVQAGDVTDLGDLVLRPGSQPLGAALTAQPDPALPGQLVQERAAFTNTTGATLGGAVLDVGLPPGAVLEPGSVTVDGQPRAVGAPADGAVAVPVGDVPAGRQVVVRLAVTLADDVAAGALTAPVRLRHDTADPVALGYLVVQVEGVTVAAPATVTERSVRVGGSAPAGAAVTVIDDDRVAGEATAGPGGRWTATISLDEGVPAFPHTITASALVQGQTLRSAPLGVTYDPGFVVPLSATVQQGDRTVSFDPGAGVSAFTMVYRSEPVKVTYTFADASRVQDLVFRVGSQSAEATCSATVCTASVPSSFGSVGPIYADYRVVPARVASAADIPDITPDGARAALPDLWSDLEFDGVTGTEAAHTITGHFAASGGSYQASVTTGDAQSYAPTEADDARIAATGVPFYDLDLQLVSESDSGLELRAHALVPVDWTGSPQAGVAPLAAPLARRQLIALGIPTVLVKALDINFKVQDVAGAAKTLAEAESFRTLDKLRAQVEASGCTGDLLDQLNGRLDEAETDVKVYTGFGFAFTALGLSTGMGEALALEGVVALGADTALGKTYDLLVGQYVKDTVADATSYVKTYTAHCVPGFPVRPLPDKLVADPTYIFDPSGFVYEGDPSHRLAGVTATLLTAPSADGPWTEWDAAAFGQTNPQTTDAEGAYGWDVPKGWWKVRFDKDGYRTTYSEALQVLPEHTDVNVAMVRTGSPQPPTPPTPPSLPPVLRLWGKDRVATAVAVSQHAFPAAGSARAVVLARSDAFADAMAGVPLAAAEHGPLLLTAPGRLDPATRAEILRVLPRGRTVYLLGGPASLSPALAAAVEQLGYRTVRLGGADRYATAVAVARALGDPGVVMEVSGLDFADGLSAGPVAVSRHGVILLTRGGTTPAATAAYLAAHPGVPRVALGPSAAADPTATAVVGSDRVQTSVLLARRFFPTTSRVGLASGRAFPDALVGGTALGPLGPVLLLPAGAPPTALVDYVRQAGASDLLAFGGPAVVSDSTLGRLGRLPRG